MANEVLQKQGTLLVWANSTYLPAATNNQFGGVHDPGRDIDVVGLTTGQARESTKSSFGATRARQYAVMMSVEMATDPTAGDTIDLYWGPSPVTAAAEGNPGELLGVDGDYAGYTGGVSTLAEGLAEMLYIGSLPLAVMNTADAVQAGFVGVFSPPTQFGILVWHNNSAVTVFATDSIEAGVIFIPIVDEVQ